MVMTINGLGRGPFADRRDLGERHRRRQREPEGDARNLDADQVRHRPHGGEQLRAEVAAVHGAIRQAEDALAMACIAAAGLAEAEACLEGLQDRLQGWRADPAADVAPATADDAAGRPALPALPAWWGEALAALEGIAERTTFGTLRLLDGSLGASGVALGDGIGFVAAGPRTRSSPPHGYEVLLTEEPTRATVLGEAPLTAEGIARGLQLVLRENGRTARVHARPGQQPADVRAALQAAAEREGLALAVELTQDDRLVVQHRRFGAAHRFAVASSQPGVLSDGGGNPRIVANGRDVAGTINGEPARGEGRTLTGAPGNTTTDGLVLRYTGLPYTGATHRLPRRRPAILEPRTFAGRIVVAQQALTVRLGGDPGQTVTLRLDSVRPAHLARGVGTASGFLSLADVRLVEPLHGEDGQRLVRHALGAVRERRSTLQALGEQQIAEQLTRLRVQAQNLTAASQDLLAPAAARAAVHALRGHMQEAGREALSAQAHPPQGSLLELLDDEHGTARGPARGPERLN